MTNEELLKEWQEGEQRQKALWQEILRRGLYFQAAGIFLDRRDNAWRTPPTATIQSERDFYQGCRGHRCPGKERKQRQTIDEDFV